MTELLQTDEFFMSQAIAQAQTAIYRTRPNPAVGCVLVKDGQIIGRGATAPVGGSHAEVFALQQAGENAIGATAYVTLEPCAHYGRTPPCANALIQAQVARVVIANLDPNPLVAGKGQAMLEQAGIATSVGILAEQAREQNQGFLKAMAMQMPYVRLKIASSLDGRTAMSSGESKWITGEQARQDVQHWRAISGAVITGINTVLADNCQLNVRQLSDINVADIVQPKRIILDRTGRLPLTAKILAQPEQVIVVGKYRKELADLGVIQLADQPLNELLATLCREYQIYDVLVEAGATLATSFIEQNLVDEMIHYIAPTLLGVNTRAMFNAQFEHLNQQQRFKIKAVYYIGDDLRIHLTPNKSIST